HELRIVLANDVDILPHGIGRAAIPALAGALLRRQQFDIFSKLVAQETPAMLYVLDQRMRLVLRQHADTANAGVDAVRQGKIDETEAPAKRHGRLYAMLGQRAEPRALSAGKDQCERIARDKADKSFGLRQRRAPHREVLRRWV